MPKATTEGGASNAAEPVTCADCGARYAAGAPCCPECRSTGLLEPEGDAEDAEDAAEAPEGTAGEPAADPPAPPSPPRTPPRRSA